MKKITIFFNILVPLSFALRKVEIEKKTLVWHRIITSGIMPTFFMYWLFSNIPFAGSLIYTLIIVPLAAYFHIKEAKIKSAEEKTNIYLWYFVVIVIGFGGLWSFIGHTFLAELVAKQIGWLSGSPFQTELAFYHLGLGVGGMMAIAKKSFIQPLIISKSIFWYGAAFVHISDAITNNNFSILNVGPPLIGDILIPSVMLTLLFQSKYIQKNKAHQKT